MTRTLSIRASLFVLAAAIVVPLGALGAYSIVREFRTGVERADANAMTVARGAAVDVVQLVAEAEQVLGSLAAWHARERPAPAACDEYLAEAGSLLSAFYALTVVDVDGRPVCTSRDVRADTLATLADREWFGRLMETGSFVVSKPILGRFSGIWISVFAHPLRDAEGRLVGAVTGSIDVDNFRRAFADLPLPERGVITLSHADGTVVARSVDPEEYVGTKLPEEGEISGEDLLRGPGTNRTAGLEGTDRFWAWYPIPDVEWVVFAGLPAESIFGPIRRAAIERTLVLLGVFALVGLLTAILHRRISRSLEALAADTRAASDDPEVPVREQGPREVRQVARQFNRALRARTEAERELRRTEERLRERQKMEAVGRLAGGVAHDFNNLLTVIRGEASLLKDDLPAASALRGSVDEIGRASERAAKLVRQLLAFSRREATSPRPTDLSATVRELRAVVRSLAGENVELSLELEPDPDPVFVDPNQVEQVLLNLVVNARDAMADGGRLAIATANVSVSEEEGESGPVAAGDYVVLRVEDSGQGMEARVQERIFEPFFTTKPREKGTGLGLSTVYGIVTRLGGDVTVESEPGEGSAFTLYFPVDPSLRAERVGARE